MKRLSLMVTEPLFEQIELARGDVPRERWLRRAVERALGESVMPRQSGVAPALAASADPPTSTGAGAPVVGGPSPAPAEQPEKWEGFPVRADDRVPPGKIGVASARPFRPYPKGGK